MSSLLESGVGRWWRTPETQDALASLQWRQAYLHVPLKKTERVAYKKCN